MRANIWILDRRGNWRVYMRGIPWFLVATSCEVLRTVPLYPSFFVEWEAERASDESVIAACLAVEAS